MIFRICQISVKITRTEFEICFAKELKGISLEYKDCNVIGRAKIKSPGKKLCKYKVKYNENGYEHAFVWIFLFLYCILNQNHLFLLSLKTHRMTN